MEIGPAQACAVKVVVQAPQRSSHLTRKPRGFSFFSRDGYYPLSKDPSLCDAWFTVTNLSFVSEAIALVQVSLQKKVRIRATPTNRNYK